MRCRQVIGSTNFRRSSSSREDVFGRSEVTCLVLGARGAAGAPQPVPSPPERGGGASVRARERRRFFGLVYVAGREVLVVHSRAREYIANTWIHFAF